MLAAGMAPAAMSHPAPRATMQHVSGEDPLNMRVMPNMRVMQGVGNNNQDEGRARAGRGRPCLRGARRPPRT